MVRRIVVRRPTTTQPWDRSFHLPVGTAQGRGCSIADLFPGQTARIGRVGVISTHRKGNSTTWYEESSLDAPPPPQPWDRSFHLPVGTTQGRACSIADLLPGQAGRNGRIGVISTHGRGKATTRPPKSSFDAPPPHSLGTAS